MEFKVFYDSFISFLYTNPRFVFHSAFHQLCQTRGWNLNGCIKDVSLRCNTVKIIVFIAAGLSCWLLGCCGMIYVLLWRESIYQKRITACLRKFFTKRNCCQWKKNKRPPSETLYVFHCTPDCFLRNLMNFRAGKRFPPVWEEQIPPFSTKKGNNTNANALRFSKQSIPEAACGSRSQQLIP